MEIRWTINRGELTASQTPKGEGSECLILRNGFCKSWRSRSGANEVLRGATPEGFIWDREAEKS